MLQGITGLLASLCAALIWAAPVQAQSAYGCRNLETHDALPAIEGKEGFFFRITPDLIIDPGLADETVAQMARLSKALEGRGTTLVLLPVPGRAQVMSHLLPATARQLGYDAEIATSLHLQTLARLEEAGVLVADVRSRLRRAALAGERVFFDADPRPTPAGARIIAQVVAELLAEHPATRDLSRGSFVTQPAGEARLTSIMRAKLQLACQDPLPELVTAVDKTSGGAAASNAGILGVIGSDLAATDELNLAGYISEFSGLRAGAYGVSGGGAYAAISSYMTSRDFAEATPAVLVWEFPIDTPFGLQGDQPMRELIAAAANSCAQVLGLTPGKDGRHVIADLSALPDDQQITLALDTDGAAVAEARFHFTSADNLTRSRGIWRHPSQVLTGRFFLPLSGLQATGLRRVEIELTSDFGPRPVLRACLEGDL